MANYTPPDIASLPFDFGTGGYTAPDFSSLEFSSGLRPSYTQTADMQAAIEVMGLYQDSTYTYLKECKTIVVGYGQNGVQTLQLPCLYGGIRDLGVALTTSPPSADLQAYIFALFNFLDLAAFVRTTKAGDPQDVSADIKPWERQSTDLWTWFRPATLGIKNLPTYMKIFQGKEIPSDLAAYLIDIQPADVQALLNVIEIRDISAEIEGIWWKGSKDLSTEIYKIYLRASKNLSASLHGYQTLDLSAYISAFWYGDLSAEIIGGFFGIIKDLKGYLNTVQPVDLYASLHGYDTKNLAGYLSSGYQDNDLPSYVLVNQPKSLPASIRGFFGIESPVNLPAYISGSAIADIQAYISMIESSDLAAYIDAVGKYADLYASIVPKTIHIKRVVSIPLMEHKDLFATINYNCLLSGYRDLPVYFHLGYKADLKGYIIGWKSGQADNIRDLSAHINVSDVVTTDTYDVNLFSESVNYTLHPISGGSDVRYRTVDTYGVFGGNRAHELQAYITGILESKDLGANISAIPLANYTSAPSWVSPKTREVVINLDRFESRWRRFVDLMFFTNAGGEYHYFYVSGTNSVYKIDRDRTWVIWVTGYTYNDSSIIDRVNIRKKFLFNLKDYNNVDEAMRSMIDRVAELRHRDLGATITAELGNYTDLSANMFAVFKTSWMAHLRAVIRTITKDSSDLQSTIQPLWATDSNNLSASIVAKSYEPPEPDGVDFVFTDDGFIPPIPYSNVDWSAKQAEDFWKDKE